MTDGSSSTNNGTGGIEVALLEKRLEGLRDTQESVQGLSLWCQANKKHSTPIIDTWLRVLRRSPVEKRLTMFYLANDVVQHAKKKGDVTVVNQWAVAVQKATPHVRSPSSVSTAIIRIFKIWEERSIYSKDTVADLIALVNKHNPTGKESMPESKKKPETYTASDEKVKEFQSSSLVASIKQAFKLKSHLGVTFRTKQYVHMNMEQLMGSIKDRQHGTSVIENMVELLEACKISQNKLVHEVEERRRIVEAAEVGIVFYENVRFDAGVVNGVYREFTAQVMRTKTKVDEMIRAFAEMEGSPVSSPGRLSPFEDLKVVLPPLAEFEARQAQVSNLIQVLQSDSTVNATTSPLYSSGSIATTTSQSQYSSSTLATNTSNMNMMQQGMLPSGTAYDLMSASQWPNYAMQFQMMQMAQNYAYPPGSVNAMPRPPSIVSSDIGSIPLPPSHEGSPANSQQQQRSMLAPPVPPLDSPIQSSTPNDSDSAPAPSVQFTPTSPHRSYGSSNTEYSAMEYGNEEYQPEDLDTNSFSYDSGGGEHDERSEEYLESQAYNSITNPPSTSRYHPYSNSTPRRAMGSTPRLRATRFSSQGPSPSPGFRNPPPFTPRSANAASIPFNPRNPNTTPILRRGGPRFSSYSQQSPGQPTPNTTTNLLRLAQYQVDQPSPQQPQSQQDPAYGGYPTNNYQDDDEGNGGLNGDEMGDFQGYDKPPPPRHVPRGRGSVAMVRMPRGFKSPSRGSARGSFGVGSPGFRGGRGRGGPSPRRGSYFILK